MLRSFWSQPTEGRPDEEALLSLMEQQVSPETLKAFAGTSELPGLTGAGGGGGSGSAAEVRCLLGRFLRAEKLDVERAVRRLQEQASWRRGYGSVSEEDVLGEIACRKVMLQRPTASSAGRPLLIVKASRHIPGATPQAVQQFIFFSLEATSFYCWDESSRDGKLVALIDLSDLKFKNLDAAALRACFTMLATHFPERIATVYMLDAPTIFWGLWKVVEPFVDRTTRKNIRFVSGKAGRAELVECLGPEVVPLEYGGAAAEVPVELAAKQLASWKQQRGQQKQQQHLGRWEQGQEAREEASSAAAAADWEGSNLGDTTQHGEAERSYNGVRLSRSSSSLPIAP